MPQRPTPISRTSLNSMLAQTHLILISLVAKLIGLCLWWSTTPIIHSSLRVWIMKLSCLLLIHMLHNLSIVSIWLIRLLLLLHLTTINRRAGSYAILWMATVIDSLLIATCVHLPIKLILFRKHRGLFHWLWGIRRLHGVHTIWSSTWWWYLALRHLRCARSCICNLIKLNSIILRPLHFWSR